MITRDGNTSNLSSHLRFNHPLTAAKMHWAPSSLSETVSTPPADADAGPTTTKSTATYTQLTVMGGLRENNEVQKGQCPLEDLH